MLTSEGDWTRCGYATRWLRSATLLDWAAAESGMLLDVDTTGVCGPGGADLVEGSGGRTLVFLHGWTCRGTDLPVRRAGGSGTTSRGSAGGGRCTPPSWAGSAVCPRSPTGSGRPDAGRT